MFRFTVFAILIFTVLCIAASAQRRDYMTDAEIELVRDAQEIDLRVGVLTRAIDRRFAVLSNQSVKESDEWGPAPTGTRLQLLSDVQKLLDKAISDIDNVAEKNRDSKLFPKAVHTLAGSCSQYDTKLRVLLDTTTEQKEKGVILGSLDLCSQVREAVAQMPPEPTKEEKTEKNKKKKND